MKPNVWGKFAIVAILLIAVITLITIKNSGRRSSDQPSENIAGTGSNGQQTENSEGGMSSLPRLLELGSEACQPCQMMKPVLADLTKEYAGKLQVDYIDVWKDEAVGRKYGVQAIPTQLFFDANGKEVFRHVGFYPKDEILAKFKDLNINL